MTGIISIGRGTEGKDLVGQRWDRFIRDVNRAVRDIDGDLVFRGRGLGTYVDAAGQKIYEEAYTVVFVESGHAPMTSLRNDLALLARKYNQAAIALTFGEVEFVKPAV